MRLRPVGRRALLLEWATPEAADIEAWRAELSRRRDLGELAVVDIVPAARTILLDGLPDPAATATQVASWPPPAPSEATSATMVTVPVRYDGPDLAEVARHWGVDVTGAVERLTGIEFTVAFCGFAPGFGYLTGLPASWTVPRRASPRPAVPAGSVALAGEYAGIYPTASPGGWQLVGRTDLVLFDLDREQPATLAPGTRVRLSPVGPPPDQSRRLLDPARGPR
ncbi:5-oxoprolinase subunit B family protein [Micromonospora sp. NBC_01813]|uniref:5-oxoprolinase subunit B family protein n=1 Tax=Micromonospora sp. NBC_01813 TaxID=2975988 RepID=UPI002DDB31D8|nr:allophanate hydrolase subunit 1 [Micromonospora sp. NBC_01813]WSA07429.1 allophanate hydrolase subunit 1 [Micromonospora sp. NBC_01813]